MINILLLPLAGIYLIASFIRNILYDFGVLESYKSNLHVISIGNFTVGGSGKTPLVIDLAKRMTQNGYQVAVLTRGYKGSEIGPFLIDSKNLSSLSAQRVGDEPIEIAELSNVPVIVAKKRVEGARFIENHKLGNLIILDDGFQHRALSRDIDIVCIDCSSSKSIQLFLDRYLMPLGKFREMFHFALKRASYIVLSKRQLIDINSDFKCKEIEKLIISKPFSYSGFKSIKLINISGNEVEYKGKNCIIFCGIANPEGFISSVSALGMNVISCNVYSDHYNYSEKDIKELQALALANDALLITTKKDFVRITEELRVNCNVLSGDFFVNDDIVNFCIEKLSQ